METGLSNNFSYGKCWNFGKAIRNANKESWDEIMQSDPWKTFQEKHKLSTNQLFYTKRGFDGLEFQSAPIEDQIMPFAPFKGQRFGDLKPKYIQWLSNQSWLDKWPDVKEFVDLTLKKDATGATLEDIHTILSKIE